MAILPRTLLTQPAPAAVAAVSLFGLTVLGTTAMQVVQSERVTAEYESPCAEVSESQGMQQFWSEASWLRYVYCFDQHNDSSGVVIAASEGLERYPQSERLYNVKAYHQIELHQYRSAVDTLKTGLGVVGQPTNGVMENNLAWSYLWVGEGDEEKSRRLYQASLDREPYACETIHTGLFVEFETARNSAGVARAEALMNFQSLRNRYQSCENRDAKWGTVVESAGASVLYGEVEAMMNTPFDGKPDATMRAAAQSLRRHHSTASAGMLCSEAMPFDDLRRQCIQQVKASSVSRVKRAMAREPSERTGPGTIW